MLQSQERQAGEDCPQWLKAKGMNVHSRGKHGAESRMQEPPKDKHLEHRDPPPEQEHLRHNQHLRHAFLLTPTPSPFSRQGPASHPNSNRFTYLISLGTAHAEHVGSWPQTRPLLLQDIQSLKSPLATRLPTALSGQQEAPSGKGTEPLLGKVQEGVGPELWGVMPLCGSSLHPPIHK